jgi:hypothetical protein
MGDLQAHQQVPFPPVARDSNLYFGSMPVLFHAVCSLAVGDPAAGAAAAASVSAPSPLPYIALQKRFCARNAHLHIHRYCKMLERRFDLLADPSFSMGGVDAQVKAWDAMVLQELQQGARLAVAPGPK